MNRRDYWKIYWWYSWWYSWWFDWLVDCLIRLKDLVIEGFLELDGWIHEFMDWLIHWFMDSLKGFIWCNLNQLSLRTVK